jgi:hypothetical protein
VPSGFVIELPLTDLTARTRKILAARAVAPHPRRVHVCRPCGTCARAAHTQEFVMTFTIAHIQPLVALVAGILILIVPRLLNYIVALYLIVVGVAGLNTIHHFIR